MNLVYNLAHGHKWRLTVEISSHAVNVTYYWCTPVVPCLLFHVATAWMTWERTLSFFVLQAWCKANSNACICGIVKANPLTRFYGLWVWVLLNISDDRQVTKPPVILLHHYLLFISICTVDQSNIVLIWNWRWKCILPCAQCKP
jgi:hypothetical protein